MKTVVTAVFCLCLTAAMQAQTAYSKCDKSFIKCAAEGNLMEVKLGQLAESKGLAQQVKDLGQMMEKDHTAANVELKTQADAAGVAIPAALTPKQQKMLDKLSAKSGKEFDKCYAKAMVKDHKHDICKYKKEAKKGSVRALRDWAGAKVPLLESHLAMAKNTCAAVKDSK
ncbi:MAG: DUF4142 domain-containing protein [Bacteroidia bacterium]